MADGQLEETAVADCLMIAKHFEKAAAFSTSEESVFALMTPLLTTSRIQAKGISNQISSAAALTSLQSSEQKIQATAPNAVGLSVSGAANLSNMDKASEKDESIFTRVKGQFLPNQGQVAAGSGAVNSEIFGNIFNSKCIPCGDRLNMAGELNFKIGIKSYFQYWKDWLIQHLQMLWDLLTNFSGPSNFIDLCALIKFLKEFICVPDLARMLSALMALLSSVNFDINGIFDLILQLAAPLLQPFLSNFVNMLQKYIMLIIAPLECIINAIQAIISKLDYNVIFQNIGQLDKSFSVGRRQGEKTGTTGQNLSKFLSYGPAGAFVSKPPWVQVDADLHDGPRAFSVETNLLDDATGGAIKRENEKNKAATQQAAEELQALQAASNQVDTTDPNAVERYNQQMEAAREKYRAAKEKQDLSALGRANRRISEFTNKFKSALFSLIAKLREAAQKVEAFFRDIFDELKKLMGEFFGGGGSMAQLLASKLEIIQLISMISQIIKLFSSNLNCNDDKDIQTEKVFPAQANLKVWTDEEGGFHIEEDPEVIRRAVDSTVKAFGAKPSNAAGGELPLLGGPAPTGNQTAQEDRGQAPSEQTPRQKLESLIEFTGDPVLDSSISRITEALTTPVNVVFKCPLQTTVADAEQVNKWIRELNTA